MIFGRTTALAVIVALGSGCGWLSDDRGLVVDRSDDYLDARERPELLIPEDLSGGSIREVMVLPPEVDIVGAETYPDEAPRPRNIYAREEAQSVRIQKLGERRWLLIPQVPAMVWPKVKQFFSDSGVEVAVEQPQQGRLDSRWLTVDSGGQRDVIRLVIRDGRRAAEVSSGRDRLLVRLEQGIRERTAEIHLRHENDATRTPGDGFPAQSDIPGIEAEMLSELGGYIAANVSSEAISFVATNISTQTKAQITRDGTGEPVLVLYLDFERAWATVHQSLLDADVEILSADQDSAQLDVLVTESNLNQEEKGWVRSLLDGNDGAVSVRVSLGKATSSQTVKVADSDGTVMDEDLSEQILLMIREFAT